MRRSENFCCCCRSLYGRLAVSNDGALTCGVAIRKAAYQDFEFYMCNIQRSIQQADVEPRNLGKEPRRFRPNGALFFILKLGLSYRPLNECPLSSLPFPYMTPFPLPIDAGMEFLKIPPEAGVVTRS